MLCVVLWIGILGLTTSPSLMGRTRTQSTNWGNLMHTYPGAEIKIVMKQGDSQRGWFQSVTPDAIGVHIETGDQTFARADIAQILEKRPGHRAKHAWIGLAIGGAVGLALGAVADSNSNSNYLPNEGKAILTTLGVLAGAGIGALLPAPGWKTIYKSS
jgi:hypothetical protein